MSTVYCCVQDLFGGRLFLSAKTSCLVKSFYDVNTAVPERASVKPVQLSDNSKCLSTMSMYALIILFSQYVHTSCCIHIIYRNEVHA